MESNKSMNPKDLELLMNSLEHIEYEVNELNEITRMFKFYEFKETCLNSHLNSWLIHCRNIIDFLTNQPKKDDLTAEDFFLEGYWRSNKNIKSEYLQSEYKKINKMLSHLTYSRVEYKIKQKMGWDIHRIYDEVVELFNDFVNKFKTKGITRNEITIASQPFYDEIKFEVNKEDILKYIRLTNCCINDKCKEQIKNVIEQVPQTSTSAEIYTNIEYSPSLATADVPVIYKK